MRMSRSQPMELDRNLSRVVARVELPIGAGDGALGASCGLEAQRRNAVMRASAEAARDARFSASTRAMVSVGSRVVLPLCPRNRASALLTAFFCFGCISGAHEVVDPSVLDRLRSVCAIPLAVPAVGLSTASLRSDGTLLTVSHSLPRGCTQGVCILGQREVGYAVLSSGDGLAIDWQQASAPDWSKDWAVITPSPTARPAGAETRDPATASSSPSAGEILYLIGYSGAAERPHVLRLTVIAPPKSLAPARDPDLIWLEADEGSVIHRGYSGGPIVRLGSQGAVELCGILRGAGFSRSGGETRLGVAVAIRRVVAAGSSELQGK